MEPRRDFLDEHDRFLEGVIPHDLPTQALGNQALSGLVSLEEEDEN